MRIYNIIILGIVFLISSFSLAAQDNAKEKKVAFTTKDKFQDCHFDVKEKGIYSVIIMDPAGSIVSKPTYQKEYAAGEKIKTKINSKYWRPGDYYVLLEKDYKVVDRYQINVTIDREAKMKKDQEKYARKNE